MSIASQVYELFAKGLNNKEVLEYIIRNNPGCNTKMASIYWYRNEVRKGTAKITSTKTNIMVNEKDMWSTITEEQRLAVLKAIDDQELAEFRAWKASKGE